MNLVRFMNNRVPPNKRYQPTEYEHAANCATHAMWIIPSLLGSSLLHYESEDRWERLSAWVYGAGLSSLFIISTLFHTVAWKKSHLRSVEQCFHMCDRMVIYFFIAASYAPWLNLRELGPWACHMRWLVWVMASFGTTYVFFFHERSVPTLTPSCGSDWQLMLHVFYMAGPNFNLLQWLFFKVEAIVLDLKCSLLQLEVHKHCVINNYSGIATTIGRQLPPTLYQIVNCTLYHAEVIVAVVSHCRVWLQQG
ncbi:PREDICTED: monocyte to macrophage differentiation factor 2-like isoform X1 [Cyprinodon variegatus]|uniref:monocyte to macrophage differentiation factor 2-like isoform X1 n=1 Tax=Cyprinodon variegatus TaxID=28743 RepID=UPI000742B901|nr:PREDICTED: monocyte to macrophage differentiation factor 2-like isoform X1 [Cyprinodon variegatus]